MAGVGIIPRPYNFLYRKTAFGIGPDQDVSQDSYAVQLTCGLWGRTAADDVNNQIFVFHLPKNAGDIKGGGICQATGYWSAPSGLVTVDGMRFIKEFAPVRVAKP